jgi:hypothetical protein
VPTDSKLRRAPVQPRNLWTTITEHAQSKRRLSGRRNKSGRIYFFDTAKWDVGTQHSQLSSFFSLRQKKPSAKIEIKIPLFFLFRLHFFRNTFGFVGYLFGGSKVVCDIVLNVWEGRTRERGWLVIIRTGNKSLSWRRSINKNTLHQQQARRVVIYIYSASKKDVVNHRKVWQLLKWFSQISLSSGEVNAGREFFSNRELKFKKMMTMHWI